MTKETEKKARRIAALINEKVRLDERSAQIDAEMETLLGAEAHVSRRTVKAKKEAKPGRPAKGVALPCCGAKSPWRHKNGCPKRDGNLPPDTVPLKWECVDCFTVERSEEKPERCECGSTSFVQKN